MDKQPLTDTESTNYCIWTCLSPEIHVIIASIWTRMVLQISPNLRINVTLKTIIMSIAPSLSSRKNS